jgi:hypothetical protein
VGVFEMDGIHIHKHNSKKFYIKNFIVILPFMNIQEALSKVWLTDPNYKHQVRITDKEVIIFDIDRINRSTTIIFREDLTTIERLTEILLTYFKPL